MRATPGRNAVLVLALLSIIWSYNWVVMKQVLQWTGPFEFAAWRGALGAVVLFVLLLVRRELEGPGPLQHLLHHHPVVAPDDAQQGQDQQGVAPGSRPHPARAWSHSTASASRRNARACRPASFAYFSQ